MKRLTDRIRCERCQKWVNRISHIEQEDYSLYGCMKGTVEIKGNIVESTGEIWEAQQ